MLGGLCLVAQTTFILAYASHYISQPTYNKEYRKINRYLDMDREFIFGTAVLLLKFIWDRQLGKTDLQKLEDE